MNVQWEAFRAQMRRRRLDLGLTQTEVAMRMNRSQDYVSLLENGTSIPLISTVWLWTDALDGEVKVEWK